MLKKIIEMIISLCIESYTTALWFSMYQNKKWFNSHSWYDSGVVIKLKKKPQKNINSFTLKYIAIACFITKLEKET